MLPQQSMQGKRVPSLGQRGSGCSPLGHSRLLLHQHKQHFFFSQHQQQQLLLQHNRAIATTPTGPLLPDRAEQVSRKGAQDKWSSRVAIFVEPSPFSHVSGMKNRFECLIKGLTQAGDDVMVFTPDRDPPKEFCGAKVMSVLGFKLPLYKSPTLLLSTALSVRVLWHLLNVRPDVIHVSTPGIMVFAATLYAKALRIPLVMSYHTHVPEYIPKYTWRALVDPCVRFMWSVIRWCTRRSDLTLVTSKAMKDELIKNMCRVKSIDVWQRGVDTEVFHPKFRCQEMRSRMSDGNPEAPLLLYVGRLGAEKNLAAIKGIMEQVPGSRLAFVGDGPSRAELEQHFAGMPVVFMGMMRGEALSQAYASADIFVMPSETETLGFVVLEAMASGLPVVAVAAGGIVDVITQPGVSGLMYPAGDYSTASRMVGELVADKEMQRRISKSAREEVEKLGWSAATSRLREHQYQRAIDMNRNKQRFGFLALRVGVGRLIRLLGAGTIALIMWLVSHLDYARHLRTPPAATA